MMPAKIIESSGEQNTEEATDFSKLKKAELVTIAKEKGVDHSGTKKDILERLNS